MASSEHIKALLLSHLERDEDRFLSIALQVAAHEARSGHGKIAQELRDIVEKARKSAKTAGAVPIARGLKDSSDLLFATSPKLRLVDLIVPDEVNRDFPWKTVAERANGLSSAEITLVAQDAIKDLLIHEHDQLTMPMLEAAISDRRGMSHRVAA